MFPGAIAGEQLQRLQHAFDHWAERCKADWLDRIDRGEQAATYYDIPDPLDKDEIFIDIVDHPSYFGCLSEFTGGQPIVLAEQVRTVPPWPFSYTSWHPDVPHSNPLHIKVADLRQRRRPRPRRVRLRTGQPQALGGAVHQAPAPGEHAGIPHLHRRGRHRGHVQRARLARRHGQPRRHAAQIDHLIYEQRTDGRVEPDTFTSIAHLCTTPERRRLFSLEQ